MPVCATACFVELVIDNCATDRSLSHLNTVREETRLGPQDADARTVLRGSTTIESQQEGWPTYYISRRHGSNPGARRSTSQFAPVSLCRASHCLRRKGHMNTHAVVEDEKRVETEVE